MSIFVITGQQLTVGKEITVESNYHNVIDYFKDKESIGIDTETTGFDNFNGKLLTLQLGNQEHQWIIDATTIDVLSVKELIESKLTLYHNFAFDGKWLKSYGIEPKNIYDSFLVECILTAGRDSNDRGLGLNDVSKKYLNIETSKEDRGLIYRQGLSDRVIRYCAHDVANLHAIREKQLEKVKQHHLERIVELENKVAVVFMRMCYKGILIDSKKWLEVADLTEETVRQTSKELDTLIVESSEKIKPLRKFVNTQTNLFDFNEKQTYINWASPSQKKEILNALGIRVDDVADKTLQKLKKHKIVEQLIVLSKNQKLSTSFGREFINFINKTTKRIHPEIWQVLSGSARISMSKPNCQQLPSHGELADKIMSAIIAEEGKSLVTSDVGQFELALIAEYSKDPLWLEIFKSGKDLHAELCSKVFKIPIERVRDPFPMKPDLTYRYVSKTISFGLSYGLSEFKLSDILQTTPKEAKKIIDQFFTVVPKVREFLDLLAKSAIKYGRITSDPYFRRIRWFPNLDTNNPKTIGETERAAKNYVPQSSNGNLLKQCLINLQDIIDTNHYPVEILLTVHDSIVSQTDDSFAEQWKLIQEQTMKDTISLIIKSFTIKIDSVIGKNWKH